MNYILTGFSILVAIQAAVIVGLLAKGRRDTLARKTALQSEERFRLMADRAPVMMWTARPDTTLDFINHTCVEFTGVPVERLLENAWMEICHPDDLQPYIDVYMPAVAARLPFTMEHRLQGADGKYHWFLASAVPKYGTDGQFSGYIGCSLDITQRKAAEDSVNESRTALEESHREVRHLAGRLIEAQDAERARIARDLHDDVSQQLAGMSIALSSLKHQTEQLQDAEEVKEELRALHERTSALAQSVRHLSHDLHPTVLRHAGLVAAMTAYSVEVERAHSIRLKCSAEGDFTSIAPEVAVCLYRIGQEALRNVIAHAGARQAEIRLRRTQEHAELSITDDGNGFDAARLLRQIKGLGLVSISERARIAGGTVNITSEPGKGTSIQARIPAMPAAASDAATDVRAAGREYSLP